MSSDEEDEWEMHGDDGQPKDPPHVIAARQLKCVNVLLFIVGGGLCGFAYWVAISGFGGGFMAYIVALLGLLVALMSCVGCCGAVAQAHRTLLLYYSCLLFATMAAMVAGGFCFILNKQAQAIVAEEWEELSVEDGLDEDSSTAESELERNLYITGAAAFLMMFLLLCAMGSVTGIVDKQQAYSLLMQASNMTMLPFGFVLVAGAVFIADTAASADAPSTAMGIFAMGAFVIGLTLLGCISVAILARGLIKLFVVLVFVVGLLFFGFGVASFIQADTLKASITDNWTTIRRVLPPTFSGKYDQDQFTSFVEANLNAAGFISLCMGILLMTQVWAGTKLRSAIKNADREEEETYGAGGSQLASAAFQSHKRPKGGCCDLRRCWKRNWTKGTRKTRCAVICGCSCLCFFLLLVVGLCTAALYFSTSCASLSEFSVTSEAGIDGLNPLTAITLNNYSLGANEVAVTDRTSMYYTFQNSALKKSFAASTSDTVLQALQNRTMQITAAPKDPTEVLGFDVSCQQGVFTTLVPDKSHFALGDSYEASLVGVTLVLRGEGLVSNEASLGPNAPRFKFIDMVSEHGAGTLDTVKIGDLGAKLEADSGELYLKNVDGLCNPDYVGDEVGGIRLTTRLGGIVVEQSVVKDCDIVANAQASLVRIDRVTSTTSHGSGALISATGENGLIEVLGSTADQFLLRGNKGSVKVSNVTVHDTLKASSVSGNVVISSASLALRGSVQVETTSGSVNVKLSKFAGFVSLHSAGTITVRDDTAAQWDSVSSSTQDNMNTVTANVNCASQNNCAYLGEVLVISQTGSIVISVDAWDQEQ